MRTVLGLESCGHLSSILDRSDAVKPAPVSVPSASSTTARDSTASAPPLAKVTTPLPRRLLTIRSAMAAACDSVTSSALAKNNVVAASALILATALRLLLLLLPLQLVFNSSMAEAGGLLRRVSAQGSSVAGRRGCAGGVEAPDKPGK